MPARLIGQDGDMEQGEEQFDLPAGIQVESEATSEPEVEALDGDDVPEQYRGKTAAELLEIVRNQEQLIGRHGQEVGDLREQVGTLRGQVDAALALRDPGKVGQKEFDEEELSNDDFFTDPADATRRMVDREIRDLREEQRSLQLQRQAEAFEQRHPTASDDLNDQAFADFVGANQRRITLAQKAMGDADNIDFDAADELWSLYEEYREIKAMKADNPVEDAVASEALDEDREEREAPSLVSGNSGSVVDPGTDRNSGKPIYSQAALNDLMMNDPDTYWSDRVQRDLTAAYAEGRVRQDS